MEVVKELMCKNRKSAPHDALILNSIALLKASTYRKSMAKYTEKIRAQELTKRKRRLNR